MADIEQQPVAKAEGDGAGTAQIVYILYLVAIVFWPIAVVGVIMSYVNRGEAAEWVASHYRFQIRTFWIGLLISLVGVVTVFFLVGYVVLLAGLVWWIVRCVTGLRSLAKSEAYPNPTSWLW